ncbi:hypothetical protein BDW66DRAFT_140909 [Aspergillus desertorum]
MPEPANPSRPEPWGSLLRGNQRPRRRRISLHLISSHIELHLQASIEGKCPVGLFAYSLIYLLRRRSDDLDD